MQASDGSYVRVSYSWRYGWRGDDGNTYDSSTTQFYSRSETSSTSKLAALKSAVNGFLDSTASQNEKIEDENSKIRVSIVKFAGTKKSAVGNDTYGQNEYNNSQIVNNLTSDMSALKSSVRALRAGGATSADYGMELASTELGKARSDANKCVIFFTDGEPNHSKGFDDSVANSAISTAKTLKNSGTTVYSIGVLSGADPSADPTSWNTSKANKYLQAMSSNYPKATGYTSLGSGDYTSGYYKAASSSEELSSIFDDIFNNISSTTTISNVSLTDNLTSMTATSLVNGEAGNFTYTKTDAKGTTELTGFPEASYQDGKITWDLGNTVLENGVTYTVHAKVWPSQTALDLVADLNNGTKQYSDLTADQKSQLKLVDNVYTLYTNPDDGNTISYKTVTTKTSSKEPSGTKNDNGTITGDDGFTYTKNADGTWSGTKTSDDATTDAITNPSNGMAVNDQQVSFKKVWEGGPTTQTSLTAELQKEGSDYVPVTVTSDKNWTTTTNVAMGIIDKDGTVLESGHDYTVTEPSYTDYHFEYSGEIYRPMLINNVPTVLVKIAGQEDGAYQIDGSWYKPAAATGTITATNVRKSTLNLSKTVVDNSANSDAPADALFTFTAKVTDSKASVDNVWFSIQDASGNIVKDADRVSGATAETGDTGYYYAASGSEITLKLKAGDNVRFINVSTGATYSFAETAMDNGFSFTSAEATVSGESASSSEVNDQTVSGTVSQANKTYQVAFKDTYDATKPQGFTAMKTVSGYDWTKSADIRISATGNNAGYVKIPTSAITQTVSNIKNGESQQVTFTGVEFLAEGTYTLNVKETTAADSTSDKGWMYDNSDHAITVTVAKGRDGKLAVTKVEGDNPTITNTYKADSVTVNTSTDGFFSKSVDTGNNNGSYTFNFTVEPQNGAPSPANTTASVTYNANETGKKAVDFGSITFDAAGTYNYKVTETTPSDGWTTPNAKATVTVTVSDDGSGQLTAAVAGSSITNNYGTNNVTVNTAAEGSAFLTKNFDVQSGTPADKKFDFTLTKCDAQGNVADGATPLSGSVTYTKGQAETSAVVDFGTLTFTQEGTYYYKAQETTENGDGWTKSSDEPFVKIVVTNDGKGHLVAEVSGTGTITNTYKANHTEVDTKDTSTGAFLTKAYNVHSGLTPNDAKFDFSIAEVDADGNPVEDGYTNTGSADYSKGQTETTAVVDLGQISYTTEGTHYYKVSETSADSNGWTKAENSDFTVKVTVTDNGKGQLVATVSGTGSIANAYSVTPVVSDPPVTKVVEGNPSKDATFSFTLTPDNPAYPMPTGTENGVKTTSITGSSSSEFGEISFTAPGTYTYTVAEVQGNAGGYTYDTNTHSIKYTVTDNGDGTLKAAVSGNGTITNTYKASNTTVDTDAEGSAFLTKAYDVADGLMPANKDFSFSITEVDADGNAVEGGYTNTGSADYAAGETSEAVDLGTITYDEPGTHYYKVTEATPDGGWTKSGDGY
ncbi:FctA domain-containing protein, partial [Olsenella sp. kh2p3]|uniref:Spy0128 family protein n=1 Tax=Olsenella sp. kh2p3 TaxID=1797112 RepID=UPI00091FFC7C